MNRRVMVFRDTVEGSLVAQTPVHVGALGSGRTDADAPFARDGSDRPVLPGTALTGALRAALGRTDDLVLWGGNPDDRQGASLVTVFDAPAEGAITGQARWHVSIDRRTGSAADHHLFTREMVPAGTRFRFRMSVETFAGSDAGRRHAAAEELLCKVVALLTGPGLQVGGATSTGLGWVRLELARSYGEDFRNLAGLLAAVREDAPHRHRAASARPAGPALPEVKGVAEAVQEKTGTDGEDPPPGCLRVVVRWRPTGPLMSKVARVGGVCDAFPAAVFDSESGGYRLLLPGQSVKGALRARAELIARNATWETRIARPFVDQLAAAARLPGVETLFGSAGDVPRQRAGRKGALRVGDVKTEVLLPVDEWERVFYEHLDLGKYSDEQEKAEQRAFAQAVYGLNTAVRKKNDKVVWFDYAVRNAIDRWSGGVAEGRLFSALEPYVGLGEQGDGAWRAIVVDIELRRLVQVPTAVRDAALALLFLTLADLQEGWVPLGAGTTRGLGAITVQSITLTAPPNPPEGSLPQALLGADRWELHDRWQTLVGAVRDGWQEELGRYDRLPDPISEEVAP